MSTRHHKQQVPAKDTSLEKAEESDKEPEEPNVSIPDPLPKDEPGIGARLRGLRKLKGLSIEDVFSQLNIPVSSLTAFENEHFENLPADIFVRGQVGRYGDLLGLDSMETANLFIEARDQQGAKGVKTGVGKPERSLAAKKLAEPSHISSATVAAVLLLVLIAFTTTFCLYTGWSPFAYFLGEKPPPVSMTGDSAVAGNQERNENSVTAVPESETAVGTVPVILNNDQQEEEKNTKDNDNRQDKQPAG